MADDVSMSWTSWLMPSLIVWMLNGVVMAAVLARLFVFGEPVTKPLTASSVSYWRSRRQADVYLAAVSYQKSMVNGHSFTICKVVVVSKVTGYSSSQHASPLQELMCHMGSHGATCHPAEVTFPPLPQPIKAGTRFCDPRGMQG